MDTFLKKRVRTDVISVAAAFIYLFTTFTTPLTHTCNSTRMPTKHSHLHNGYCCEPHTGPLLEVGLNQDDCTARTLVCNNPCTACLYSITSKFTQVNGGKALISTKVFTPFRPLPASPVIKQPNWLSSISLRAPPLLPS